MPSYSPYKKLELDIYNCFSTHILYAYHQETFRAGIEKSHIIGSIVYANVFCVYGSYAHGPDMTENVNHQHKQNKNMRGSREFCLRGSISEYFSFDEGREDQIPRKAGDHRPANETPFKWRFVGGPMIAQQ